MKEWETKSYREIERLYNINLRQNFLLGSGGYADVFKIFCSQTGKPFALKVCMQREEIMG